MAPNPLSKPITQSLVFRFVLVLITIGILALVCLLAYNHGLEDTLPFVLYFIAWTTIPAGTVCCLVAVSLSLRRGRSRQ